MFFKNMLKQNTRREGFHPIPTFLLSFPRSGNTWVRYCVEYLTKYPTTSCQSSIYPEEWPIALKERNSLNSLINGIEGVKEENPHILVKKHTIFSTEINNYPIILLIRNYKECLIRNYGVNRAREYIFSNVQDENTSYLDMLKYFDKWENNKILFYYEDILLNPKSFIFSLSNFFRISDKKLIRDFIENIDFHKSIGIKCYQNINQNSITKGNKNKTIFHSNVLSIKEKIKWDNEIEKKDPYLFNKYLKRYSEKYE